MRRRFTHIITLLMLIGLLGNNYSIELFRQWVYDLTHHNSSVSQVSQLEKILGQFEKVPFGQLDTAYLKKTGSLLPKYQKLLKGTAYYKIPNTALVQKIVGNYRLKSFVSHDRSYWKAIYGLEANIYWLIDPKLLNKALELQEELRRQAFDPEAFEITFAHRHPGYNEAVNGVGNSRHILGQAIDLEIGDIDGDGKYTVIDKDIVLKILDEKVIRDSGGIGRYPGSRTVHFDTRGYRARWDKQ